MFVWAHHKTGLLSRNRRRSQNRMWRHSGFLGHVRNSQRWPSLNRDEMEIRPLTTVLCLKPKFISTSVHFSWHLSICLPPASLPCVFLSHSLCLPPASLPCACLSHSLCLPPASLPCAWLSHSRCHISTFLFTLCLPALILLIYLNLHLCPLPACLIPSDISKPACLFVSFMSTYLSAFFLNFISCPPACLPISPHLYNIPS